MTRKDSTRRLELARSRSLLVSVLLTKLLRTRKSTYEVTRQAWRRLLPLSPNTSRTKACFASAHSWHYKIADSMAAPQTNGDTAMHSYDPEVNDKGFSHTELKKYIETNVSMVYTSVTGKTLHLDERRARRYAPPIEVPITVSMSFDSTAKAWLAFVVCDKKTFVEGRSASNMTQALLNLLEATSELMHMWRKGPLIEGELGVCALRESGGRYWNGEQRDRKAYNSDDS